MRTLLSKNIVQPEKKLTIEGIYQNYWTRIETVYITRIGYIMARKFVLIISSSMSLQVGS